jgi:ABC-type ATPase with predicted acetyltransferase domain
MEHKHPSCPHCLSYRQRAISQGFIQDFRFLPDELLYSRKPYEPEDIAFISVEPCLSCATSTYLIKTTDGVAGQAIEYWE